MHEPLATFVDVIVPISIGQHYTYCVSKELEPEIAVGKRVAVQFGKRKVYAGIIHAISHNPPKNYEAKYILSVIDEEPLIGTELMKLWEWVSAYYMSNLGEVMAAGLPAPFRLESATKISMNPETTIGEIPLSDKEYLIIEALEMQQELNLEELMEILQLKNVFPILKSLHQKEIILIHEELKESYKPKTTTCLRLSNKYTHENNLAELFQELDKLPKQLDTLLAFLQIKQEGGAIQKTIVLQKSNAKESSLKTLIKKGVFEEYKVAIDRLAPIDDANQTFALDESQEESYQAIIESFKSKEIVLLHGVTSSGKTHIYVKCIEEVIKSGKQVLFLLPEIALTSQIVARMQRYFGDKAVAFHSKYSQNERVEIWNKIRSGQIQIIIGARSSIFLPFFQLGLVIVDEEHETSYKQAEPAPRYQARDAAIVLASIWKCKTLLGSATPSFESYHNAIENRYGLVRLAARFGNVKMPRILTANLAEETRTKTMKAHFTSVLFNHIEETLNNHEQVVLFQNRRGYAPVVECQQCQWSPKCQNCDIHLTYHKYLDSLKCHYCGFIQHIPKSCLACGSHLLELKGIGTEKVEDELSILFPTARLARLDFEATKSKHGHEQIIKSFANHEADILIGTQMVSKGLDFDKVSLVGVMNADQLLHFPDFRAHERAYQMLSQVSGRAGRKQKQGTVIIQTSQPNHHIIQEVIHQRYEQVFANELEERRNYMYPPFFRLIKIIVKHKDYKICHDAAFQLKERLANRLGEWLIGPESPHVSKIRNQHIKEMLVKVDKKNNQLMAIKDFIKKQILETHSDARFKKAIIFCDVDPQ